MDYAAEEARIAVLQDLFREELGRWPVDRRKELLGELVLWGSVVPIGRSLWHGLLSRSSTSPVRAVSQPRTPSGHSVGLRPWTRSCWHSREASLFFPAPSRRWRSRLPRRLLRFNLLWSRDPSRTEHSHVFTCPSVAPTSVGAKEGECENVVSGISGAVFLTPSRPRDNRKTLFSLESGSFGATQLFPVRPLKFSYFVWTDWVISPVENPSLLVRIW